jgi:ATP-dependent Clp protease adaptor protein ClpS
LIPRETKRWEANAMSTSESAAAVAEPEVVEREAERPEGAKSKPKTLPPYAVIVYNDDLHTFDYVIETFQKVFGYSVERCMQLALAIHHQGRTIVWSGAKEVAELKRDLVRSAGPDIYASTEVTFPLGVTIEPLPG